MDQFTVKELVDAVIGELRRLGYKKSTIHNYEKVYADLIRYAEEQHTTEYTIELGEKYLREVRGIDPFYVASGSDSSYNKQNYLPIRVCQCLVEWKLHGCLSLKKQGKLASQNLPEPLKPSYDSYAKFCKEAGYSKRGTYTRLNRIKRMLLSFDNNGLKDMNQLTSEDIWGILKDAN